MAEENTQPLRLNLHPPKATGDDAMATPAQSAPGANIGKTETTTQATPQATTQAAGSGGKGGDALWEFAIDGMSCASCSSTVERAIRAVSGVTRANVNLATRRATLHADPATLAPESILKAVKKAGYTARPIGDLADSLSENDYGGTDATSPAAGTAPAQTGTAPAQTDTAPPQAGTAPGSANPTAPAAANASINTTDSAPAAIGATTPATNAPTRATARAKTRAKAKARARASAANAQDEADAYEAAERRALRRELIAASILTLPVFVLEMGAHLIPGVEAVIEQTIGLRESWLLQFVLTTLVLAWPGRRFYSAGIPSLLRGAPNMHSLVALGTAAAWGYSTVATFFPALLPEGTQHVYFEAAALIVTLVLLGRFLEARARGKTGDAVRHLVGLQPKSARVQRDGETLDIPVEDVLPGDLVVLRPGERVPVDGVVTEGESYLDESMLSGEPLPVAKSAGSNVTGGTVNKAGSLVFRATKVGKDTLLAQIIRMVEQAQGAKLPIQTLVDTVTLRFVPTVIVIAILTFIAWLIFAPAPALAPALVSAVAVLIIACPCAMGLATPTSVMVGTGRGAQMGVLFRKGEALQTLRQTNVVAVDKTGTLTEGRPALTDLDLAPGFERAAVLRLVAAAETRSEHPIAHAIVEAARAEELSLPEVTHFTAHAGYGIEAQIEGSAILVGADRLLRREGIDIDALAPQAETLGKLGRTPLYAAIDGRLAAVLAVADPLREGSAAAIEALHKMGLKVAMLTGDNRRTAQAVAVQLGIDAVQAEILPADKAQAVATLSADGNKVAFIGDGINDAPALAQANVGIAIGTGTDVAIESADVVLVGGDLRGAVNAIALSRATIRNIRQNLFWAFAYNAVLIPVAAGVLYPLWELRLSPVLAAGAMALSSVFVVGNALRLKRFTPPLH